MSESEPQLSNDELVIAAGIWEAAANDEKVSDVICRMIASQLHEGQTSALYALASSGAIDQEAIKRELPDEEADERQRVWGGFLLRYCIAQGDRASVDGWSQLWKGDRS